MLKIVLAAALLTGCLSSDPAVRAYQLAVMRQSLQDANADYSAQQARTRTVNITPTNRYQPCNAATLTCSYQVEEK